jgi:peptidoglycan/LPS O-acetylase OafA/YrhL
METTIRPATPSASKRISELDGLRGLAIFLVLLCHYIGDAPHGLPHTWPSRLANFFGQGAIGVDLFFVLSGFLIGGILLGSKTSPRYYRTFYLRRFHRIIPIYYGYLTLFATIWIITAKLGGESFRPSTPFWTYFFFLQNYVLRSNPIQAIWLVQLWSLAVEEQFYLVAPPLVKNLNVKVLAWLMAAIIPLCLLLRFFLATVYGADHSYWGIYAAYFWTPCRADDLALGVLVAIIWSLPLAKQWVYARTRLIYVGLIICGLLLASLDLYLLKPNSFVAATYGRTLIGLFFVLLMVILLADRGSGLARIFRFGPLKELGRVSYCVYIVHGAISWTLFRILRHDTPRFDSWPAVGVTVIALAVTIGVAELSWKYFENPLIRRGHRYSY